MAVLRPLDSFPLVRTCQADELRAVLAQVYAEPTVEFASGSKTVNAHVNACPLQNVKIGYTSYGTDLRLDFPEVDAFLQLFPIRGQGEIIGKKHGAALLAAESSVSISPNTGYTGKYGADYEFLILRIDTRSLTECLEALTGAPVNKPLQISLQQNRGPLESLLQSYLQSLVNTLRDADSTTSFPHWWISQSEQLLMTLVLHANQHNYSHLFTQEAPSPSSTELSLAEQYIEENWQQPITLQDLVTITGVSAFSLFRSFKQRHGCSPLAFVSQVRARRGRLPS